MIVAAAVAIVGLLVIAAASRTGDGRAETAIALPLSAVVALWNGYAALAVVGGGVVAYATLVAVERRTLLYGRRMRAIAAVAGAVVPLGALVGSALLGAGWPHPEVWLVGSVVPGTLAYDLRRQPPRRRVSVGAGGVAVLGSLAFSGLVLRATATLSPVDWSLLSPTGSAPAESLLVLAPLALGALALGVAARWRYGLHVGLVSAPLLAVWTARSPSVLAAYLGAAGATGIATRWLWREVPWNARRRAAVGAAIGAAVGGVATLAGVPALPALLAGALAAEDLRLARSHAGRDLTDALALAVGLLAVPAAVLALAAGVGGPVAVVAAAVAVAAGLNALRVATRRERVRPSGAATTERRWAS